MSLKDDEIHRNETGLVFAALAVPYSVLKLRIICPNSVLSRVCDA